ncbi:MAG: glycosyltransferase family 2 protein, partial [Deltaproteobacteria bacterium]|nr:glycosyltransferase family 2 protein [Deltaproteobacteria bacterium]
MTNRKRKKRKRKRGNRHSLSVDRTPRGKRKDRRPFLSVCMIVRNEERHLERCLKSIKGIADEIIVVDTGSGDRTVSIAKKYTKRIYFHPWKDSFSEARNHYLGYARGEWIFQIDADEELVQEDIPTLREAIKEDGIDAIMVQIVSHFKNGKGRGIHSVERVFRNNGVIHYEGRVHNRLV